MPLISGYNTSRKTLGEPKDSFSFLIQPSEGRHQSKCSHHHFFCFSAKLYLLSKFYTHIRLTLGTCIKEMYVFALFAVLILPSVKRLETSKGLTAPHNIQPLRYFPFLMFKEGQHSECERRM